MFTIHNVSALIYDKKGAAQNAHHTPMTDHKHQRQLVERFAHGKIMMLQNQLDTPNGKRMLAELRRSVATRPGENTATWSIEFENLPEELAGIGTQPATPAEWAMHLAITNYAVHQQSKTSPMYVPTNYTNKELHGLGHAVHQLVILEQKDKLKQLEHDQMPTRFNALITAETIEGTAHYLRQIVSQLRGKSIPLDYSRLAGQLFDLGSPYTRNNVRLELAREYTHIPFADKQ